MHKWEKIDNNEIIEGEGFYISYARPNVRPSGSTQTLVELLMGLQGIDPSTPNDGETAICFYKLTDETINCFLILDGDYRKQFEALLDKGIEACVEFYLQQPREHRSQFTNELVNSLEDFRGLCQQSQTTH